MQTRYSTPLKVKNQVYSHWWFTPAWQQMWCSNAGNNLGAVTGPNGSGKSYVCGWIAETLGVDPKNRLTRFDVNNLEKHICFSAREMGAIVAELIKRPKCKTKGYQIILEESQLILYNKDFAAEEVKNISRLLMTVRSRRWGIQMNIPSLPMLNKDVRRILNWNVDMKGKPDKYSYGTYYEMFHSPFHDEPLKKKPVFTRLIRDEWGNMLLKDTSLSKISFPLPSNEFIKNYEKMKEEHQVELYTMFNESMQSKIVDDAIKKKDSKLQMEEWVEQARDLGDRVNSRLGGFSANKISAALGINYKKAAQVKFHLENS